MSINISDIRFANWEQEVSKSTKLTLIYFWHDQCHWCMKQTPILNDVAPEYRDKIKFVKLNLLEEPENQQIAAKYGVMSTPTLMFTCSGRPLGQIVGLLSREALQRALDDMLLRHRACLNQSTELRPSYVV